MDIKIKGLSYEILVKALKQARDGRLHILEKLTPTNQEMYSQLPSSKYSYLVSKFLSAPIMQFLLPKMSTDKNWQLI